MTLNIIFLVIGLVLLIFGANFVVNGSSKIAKRFGISELIIGLTIVAIGTSAPEVFVSILSSIKGNNDIILGNVLGSNLFNLLFILGLGGIIAIIKVRSKTIKFEIPLAMISMVLVYILGNDMLGTKVLGEGLSRIDGIILLVFFILFILYTIFMAKDDKPLPEQHQEEVEKRTKKPPFSLWKVGGLILLGLVFLAGGAELVVENAVELAHHFGWSEKLIAITIVAMGTSLPELVTDMVALKKGKVDFIIGDLIGSCIFNVLLVLGLSSTISPIVYNSSFNTEIIFFIGGASILLLSMITGKKNKLETWESSIMFFLYIFFMIFAFIK